MTFSSCCEKSIGVDGTGFHVRRAVVLVRATVAEAFRDAKRGGGLKSALAGLTAEGPGGIAFVLSPSTRNVVAMALERKPSGTEKSVCMSYMLTGRGKRRQMERQRDSRQTSTSGISKVWTLYVCRASTVVKQPRGWEEKLGG
jgi:hypothetical protein